MKPSPPTIPWTQLFQDTIGLLKNHGKTTLIFLLIFFGLALPNQFFELDLSTSTPLQLWLEVSGIFILLAVSYFFYVCLVLWIKDRAVQKPARPTSALLRTSSALLVPLTILSLRGAFLTIFGFIALLIPGLYFAFKYGIASICLILDEDWNHHQTPIAKAEQILSRYSYSLWVLALVMLAEYLAPLAIEQIFKLALSAVGGEPGTLFHAVSALLDALFVVGVTTFSTLTILHMNPITPVSQGPKDVAAAE